ncbi:MAG TPA: 4Fe-4S binding protein [Sphingobacteriaceae bacterium]|nr:4Fe-4S binding protein [Sphingobacteriaceae bacterium]
MWVRSIKGLKTAFTGLGITIKHFFAARQSRNLKSIKDENYFSQQNGTTTIQYPHQQMPVPEVGRYQLHVEMDDCIVCDLCAKICPVDCIEIESIKSTGPIGQTSDGTTKRLYAPKFDIDMAKCMYCGLCTVVCPTECITMTNSYDRSFTQLSELTYRFSDMSAEDAAEKRRDLEQQIAEKQAAKEALLNQQKPAE